MEPRKKRPRSAPTVSGDSDDAVAVFEREAKELPMQSAVLRSVSPVFNAMLASTMQEASTKRINIEIATYDQFNEFYTMLLPVIGRSVKISDLNIDHLLSLSFYYQVKALMDECVAYFKRVPATIPRLLMAHQLELEKYDSFVMDIGGRLFEHDAIDLCGLVDYPKVLHDIVMEAHEASIDARQKWKDVIHQLKDVAKLEDQVRKALETPASAFAAPKGLGKRGQASSVAMSALEEVLKVITSAKKMVSGILEDEADSFSGEE